MSEEELKSSDVIVLNDAEPAHPFPALKGLDAYNEFEKLTKECLGELLTVMDASIPEERQNKAMKDVVKKIVHRMLSKSQNFCSNMDSKDGATWGSSIEL